MRWALAAVSLLVLVASLMVFYGQYTGGWEQYQKTYFDEARRQAKTEAERASLTGRQPKIEQAMVTQFGETAIDRCQTCHIAADDPRFTAAAQPLRTHPYSEQMGDVLRHGRWERRHKFNDFGCTACHDGQGRALDKADAHGEDVYWPRPLLGYATQASWPADVKSKVRSKDYLQANCARCHAENDFRSTPLVARGRELYFSQACYGCHRIDGMSYGTLGLDLTQVGAKWKLDYLWGKLQDPRAAVPTSFMPKFKLSEEDHKALVIFLKSRRGTTLAETPIEQYRLAQVNRPAPAAEQLPATPQAQATRGLQLVGERGCVACHKLDDRDGGIAPDLSYEGLIRDHAWLMDHFRDPRSRVPDSVMPAFGFGDAQDQELAAYLETRTVPPPVMDGAQTYKALCARCHGDTGDGQGMTAVYLDPAPRDFTNAAFMTTKAEARLVQSIRQGVGGTAMPPWGRVLDEQQGRAVLAHIFQSFVREPRKELKARSVPEQNPVAMSRESAARGERVFLQRCTGCHGVKADGKGPNSLDITPRPRNLRNAALVQSASDRRLFESVLYGVEGTAMPAWSDYGLSQDQVGDLVNFIRSLNRGKK